MTGTGEAVVFWILGPVALLAALGMLLVRKAVHSALLLALTMICLAILYIAQDAPFLGVVQIVVYTGAVMMLFLFVLMLVGVDSSDSRVETLRGQRVAGVVAGVGFGMLLVFALGRASFDGPGGLGQANAGGNVEALARVIFTRYAFAFEVTSALLITAGLGAMVLAHRERHVAQQSQREQAEERVRRLADGRHPGMLPPPGVYARHNAVDVPALLPDGTPADLSVSRALAVRGDVRSPGELPDDVAEIDDAPSAADLRKPLGVGTLSTAPNVTGDRRPEIGDPAAETPVPGALPGDGEPPASPREQEEPVK